MEKDLIIKRIFSLLFLIGIVGCKTTRLPQVSSKLESVFKEQEYLYKKQKVWKYVQWDYKYDRKVVDSVFTQHDLNDSEEFYIITRSDVLLNYSLEIKSIDKNKHLKYYLHNDKLIGASDNLNYNYDFQYYIGGDFIEFVNSKTQEELENCHKTSPVINNDMVLFTHYNKGDITVKRFVSCDYAEYFNLERPDNTD